MMFGTGKIIRAWPLFGGFRYRSTHPTLATHQPTAKAELLWVGWI